MKRREVLAVLLPILALVAQWFLWPWIKPFVWFLFFPTVFFSARLGGRWGGLSSTVLSAGIVWFFFMSPQLSWRLDNPSNIYSVGIFVLTGYLLSDAAERFRNAQKNTEDALAETRRANEKITALYRKTLELDELKTQFFANVSHELRTPLTLIMSPLTRRLTSDDLSAGDRHESEMMLRNARLLYRHVSDLLDAAKLESGRMVAEYARFDLGALTRATASQFAPLAQERGIAYSIDVPTPLIVETDGEMAQRILLNLLSNAFKFTPEDGRIGISLQEDADQAVIVVRDNGPGIPIDQQDAVFERFRQVEGDAKRRFGGTGLGLAIVREFAELQGGKASVTEAPGGGALFTVRLPLRAVPGTMVKTGILPLDPVIGDQVIEEGRARKADKTISTPAESPPSTAPLVLVVEDNADMNAFIADTLRPFYRVASAFDGREGLEQAGALLPDLILSDIMMPRLSGDEMVRELRKQPPLADIPIIILTARADDDLRVKLIKDGVQDYLNKPFTVDELLARIGRLISERRRTLAELEESRIRFEATFEQAAMGIALVGPDGHWLRVNRKLCQIVGYTEAELTAMTFLDITHPEDRETDDAFVQQMLNGEIETFSMEKRYIRKGGAAVWANLTVALMRHADGTPDYFISMVEDIQRRKEAEEEIRRLNTDLERRVSERTAELTAANSELASFAYAVSHDLRAPLRAMSGFSQALIEDYGEQITGEAKVYLDQIDIASRKMGELIDGILALSRSTRGELRRDPIDISALATRLLEELAHNDPTRHVGWLVAPGLRTVGDGRMIEAAFRNLLGNAWKYTGKTEAPLIRVFPGEIDRQPGFCIADNGAGFDMAHADQLFSPFRRLHRQDEFPGIGIGLATVARIVHRHGGQIRAEGQPGNGATFRFTLPAPPPEEPS